jgi:hypothetical protein
MFRLGILLLGIYVAFSASLGLGVFLIAISFLVF